MKKAFVKFGIVGFVAILTGCTSGTLLLPEAKNVKILYEKPLNCTFVGEVSGHKEDNWGNMGLKDLKDSVNNDIKNNTATLGGDIVVILPNGSNLLTDGDGRYGVKEYYLEGHAYKCK